MDQQINFFLEDEQIREKDEDSDAITSVMPPRDIVAFNELRSCSDLYRLYYKKYLDLNPDFQRGFVWSNKSQTLFIDSLIKQLPIPSLCISLDINTQKRLVIDGLQRISTIVKFLDEDSDWKLSNIDEVDSRIRGVKISTIRDLHPDLYGIVENATIPVTVLRCDYKNQTHMEYLFQIFHRLNSGGNKLYNQEIRNCIYQGEFNTFLKKFVRTSLWKTFSKVNDEKIDKSRYANEELLLRFYAFYYELDSYKGKLALFLNEYMEKNRNIEDKKIQDFTNLISTTLTIIDNNLSNEINNLSKTFIEALLIGISKNIETLNNLAKDKIVLLFDKLKNSPEFSTDELSEGLSDPDKVKTRLRKAITIFSNHD